MAELQELLTDFTNMPGVSNVFLVGRDGFMLDSVSKSEIETNLIGAIAAHSFGTSESMGARLGMGEVSMKMIEYGDDPVMFSPIGQEAFLIVVADKESNLVEIKHKIEKHTSKIQEAAAV